MSKLKQFLVQEEGATAIEYGLIVALVSLAVIVGLNALGPVLGEHGQRVERFTRDAFHRGDGVGAHALMGLRVKLVELRAK